MTSTPAVDAVRDARIRELSKAHVFTSWSAQKAIDPLPLAGGEGAWFWDHQGRRFLDLTSQLVNVNLGYQHPRLTAAIQESIIAEGDAGASAAAAAAEELWTLRAKADAGQPFDPADLRTLFQAMSEHVSGIYDSERAAVEKLRAALV